MGLWIRLLGPFAVLGDGAGEPDGDGPRGLLAMLALNAGRPVSEDRLITGLFGTARRAWGRRTIHVYLARLRAGLGPDGDRLERGLGAIRFDAGPETVDAVRFEALVLEGSERSLHHALSLWHGRPLTGLDHLPFAAAEVARLERRRDFALEELDHLREAARR